LKDGVLKATFIRELARGLAGTPPPGVNPRWPGLCRSWGGSGRGDGAHGSPHRAHPATGCLIRGLPQWARWGLITKGDRQGPGVRATPGSCTGTPGCACLSFPPAIATVAAGSGSPGTAPSPFRWPQGAAAAQHPPAPPTRASHAGHTPGR